MKVNKLLYLGSIILLLLVFSSCKKYLDEKSNKSLVVPTTIEDLQALLDNNDKLNQRTTPGLGEASADDYFLTANIYKSLDESSQKVYTWRYETYNFQNDWSMAYTAVYYANLCLEQIEKVTVTDQNKTKWDNVKGSAHFFRGYYYLGLLWDYGKAFDERTASTDLGIALRTASDFNVPSTRSTIKQSYEQVISDILEAVKYLPNLPVHPLRPSKAAAYALLARCYLSMRDYENALKYADLCLQTKNELLDYNSTEVSSGALNPFQPYNKEIIFFTSMTVNHVSRNPFRATIDTALFASYGNNDLRRTTYFRDLNGYKGFKGTYSGFYLFLFSGLAVDELYLMRAECYARKGNKDAALQDLNTLLEKRWKTGLFIPVTAASSTEALDIILTERRKELLMRGLRWIDIKRLNKEGRNIIPKRIVNGQTYSLAVDANRYALPLPADVVNITGMPQNPN